MLTARDIMTTEIITMTPDTDIVAAAKILLGKKINGAPVVDENGNLMGIICQSDLVAQQKKLVLPSMFTILDTFIPLGDHADLEKQIQKIAAMNVEQAMTPSPVTVTPDTPIDEIATTMVERKLYTLPVVEGKKLVGVVGKEDVLKTLV